jgi:hypothetical protein
MTITITRPAPAAAPAPRIHPDTPLYAAVNVAGRLSITDTDTGVCDAASLARRTGGGAVHRIALADGITAWLDGDEQDGSGEVNWAATQMCTALCDTIFTGPHDAPFVCGLVLFVAATADHAVGLSDGQLARLIDAHAAAEHPDADPAEVPSTADLGW